MLERNFFIKGQSLVEVAAFLGIITLAIMAMQLYMQRGLQGKTRDLTNIIIGSQQKAYTADTATSSSSTTFSGTTKVSTVEGGGLTRTISETTTSTSQSESKNKP